jgi:Immunoglobulin-like domain of bacterial spore germination
MSDDLFERLRTVDPATEERIGHETRALGNTPGRIVETEPSNVRRLPKAARRKATLAAVAAVVVVAIALPLTLLRPLGDGQRPSPGPGGATGPGSGTWLPVGPLDLIRAQGVKYVPQAQAFVLAVQNAEPYALNAVLTDDRAESAERVLYCEATGSFLGSRGDVFTLEGALVAGEATHGLPTLRLRVTEGGQVEIDPSRPSPSTAEPPAGPPAFGGSDDCLTAAGSPLEGRPGFAMPAGTELPPVAVALPQTGMRVTSPIPIAGSADVFEATVNIRVLDANGDVIAESFAMATCGTGCRGDFSTEVDVPVDAEQPGTIQVFEYSAKDGTMINTIEVPVTLVPADTPVDVSVEGTWFDGDDQPLPDGSVGSVGTAMVVFGGAEHCQWETASFMHLGWPIGTLATTFDDERQYVRDPRGLFDDGALHIGYLSDTTLPSDATDTGYHRGPWRLWVSPSQANDAIFVVNVDTGAVERWGRATPPILCD